MKSYIHDKEINFTLKFKLVASAVEQYNPQKVYNKHVRRFVCVCVCILPYVLDNKPPSKISPPPILTPKFVHRYNNSPRIYAPLALSM